jgi:hypothetical protein
MVQERDHPGRGFRFFEDLLHPRSLAMSHDELYGGIAFHDREADQDVGDEHMVVAPVGQDRRQADVRAAWRSQR